MTLPGHRLTGWLCSECGLVAKGGGLVPSFGVEVQGGVPTPVLRLEGEDGHAQVVTLGYDNLSILIDQALAIWTVRRPAP